MKKLILFVAIAILSIRSQGQAITNEQWYNYHISVSEDYQKWSAAAPLIGTTFYFLHGYGTDWNKEERGHGHVIAGVTAAATFTLIILGFHHERKAKYFRKRMNIDVSLNSVGFRYRF